jgi:shikimate kinase
MGCGKTTAGELLAQRRGLLFFDTDEYIERKTKTPIPALFAEKGEAFFREAERLAVREISAIRGAVISCGGGVMVSETNASAARENGVVVFIDTDFETCYDRIKGDGNRPLVANNTKGTLYDIYKKRALIYTVNSDFTVSGQGTPEDVARRIERKLRKYE